MTMTTMRLMTKMMRRKTMMMTMTMTSLLPRSSRVTAKANGTRAKVSKVIKAKASRARARARTKAREKVSRARRSGDRDFELSHHVLHLRHLAFEDAGMISNGIRCRCLQ